MANLILKQNVTVTNFAYVFKEKGIYVFQNYVSEKLTVISVVHGNQTCSNTINGVGASMITEQALSEVGIQSQKKNIDPDWYFISLSFFMMTLFIFGCIGVVILGYNLHTNNISLFGGKKKKINTIYYDKLHELQEETGVAKCMTCFCCRKNRKVDNDEKLEAEKPKSHDLSFGYN